MARAINNTFQITNPNGTNAINVDSDGNAIISKLVLLDEKTGNKWQIKISDGELIAEPLELEDKREYRINKILK